MSIELTSEQQRAIERECEVPPHVVNPRTGQTYVLLGTEVYERLRGLADELDPRETYPLVDKVMAEDDANDPHLESYQQARSGGGA